MVKLFDSHAHYFDPKFDELEGGADGLLSSAEFAEKIGGVVNVGTNLENSRIAIEMAEKYPMLWAAVGIHPEDCHAYDRDPTAAMVALEEMLFCSEEIRQKIVAIGEIGLDHYYPGYDGEREKAYFEAQMALAGYHDMPVIIHDREAHGDVFDIVCKHPDVRGVMHSYSGSVELAREYVKRGYMISFSGVLTFKNGVKAKEVAAAIPLSSILIETDCPYLAPVPYRGKLNSSLLMEETALALAQIKGLSRDEVVEATAQNAKRFFGIETE